MNKSAKRAKKRKLLKEQMKVLKFRKKKKLRRHTQYLKKKTRKKHISWKKRELIILRKRTSQKD